MKDESIPLDIEVEKRLVQTAMTGKPSHQSFIISFLTVLVMAVMTQAYWQDFHGISELLPASHALIFEKGEWWRALTAMFIHADIGHYLSNMYTLAIFSYFIFGYFGFGLYPLLSYFFGSLVNILTVSSYPSEVQLLGASGLVYLLGGVWLTLYLFIQRQYSVGHRILRVVGIALMIFFPTSFVPNVSYRAHAIGFFLGIFLGVVFFQLNKNNIRSKEKYKEILS